MLRPDQRRGDRIDQQMARDYLRGRYTEARLALQLEHMQPAAERLVKASRRQIEIVADALLRNGTLTGDQILELLNGAMASWVR
jgi:hypothetical protein